MGVELASIGVQIHGGMGFVEETGAAQHFRDARIAPIYEGTNGIQAIDLAGRKLGMRQGGVVRDHLTEIGATIASLEGVEGLQSVREQLSLALDALRAATEYLLEVSGSNPSDMLAGAMAYLNMMAITTGGQILADAALSARSLGAEEAEDAPSWPASSPPTASLAFPVCCRPSPPAPAISAPLAVVCCRPDPAAASSSRARCWNPSATRRVVSACSLRSPARPRASSNSDRSPFGPTA